MTIQGGKPIRDAVPDQPPSPFAPLKPLVHGSGQDVENSLSALAKALGSYEGRARLHLQLIDGNQISHWEIEAGRRKAAVSRRKPKSADVHVVLRQETWLEIAQGRLSPFEALFGGRLRIGGDVELGKRIVKHLTDPSVPFVLPC
jgi:predicted lipid carrier protein YhbT